MFIIVLRQFWSRGLFFGMQALPKNRGAYVDDQNCQTGLTGAHKWSDRSDLFQIRQSADRSDWNPRTTRTFFRFRYVIGFLTG